jgi:branched-chain amino acid transport system ATP-binding protein
MDDDVALAVDGLSLRFGGIVVLDGVTFDVRRGEIFSLIGPNGAGKSSLFNCVSRLYQPSAGTMVLDGVDLADVAAHEVVRHGVARTFQNCALFPTMTVLENVLLGAYRHQGTGLRATVAGAWRRTRRVDPFLAQAHDVLALTALTALASRPALELDYPSQKRVELARALMTSPSLLLLDEPAGGLTEDEAAEISALVRDLRRRLGLTVLLVEHRMSMVMSLSDRVCVLESGRVIATGQPDDVASDPAVVAAYLGADFGAATHDGAP